MEHTKLTELLHQVASGDISVEKAALELKTEPFDLIITERFVRERQR